MRHPSPASWLALPLLLSLASGAALAQMHVHSHSDAPAPAPAHATAEPAPSPLAYRSAFDGYRPFADGQPTSWTEANAVAALGAAHSATSAEPAAGSAAAGKPDPHAGHAMPMAMPMPSHHRAHP